MYRFVALEIEEATEEQLQCLTSQVMRWNEHVWLFDLQPVLRYWQKQANHLQLELPQLWRKVLQQSFVGVAGKNSNVIPMRVRYRAAAASQPWLALLILQRLQERKLTGLVLSQSDLAKKLLHDMPWESFWNKGDEVGQKWELQKTKGFRGSQFRQEKAKFQRSILRLGMLKPIDLKHIEAAAVKRRFGSWWSRLWQWTYHAAEVKDWENYFPWQSWEFRNQPGVRRHLDYAVHQWDDLEEFLREDFDRLAEKMPERQRVQRIQWEWVRSDLTHENLSVFFRHPHNLRQEKGEQHTALLQAYYQFEDHERQKNQSHEEEGITPPYIVSWVLTVAESLLLPPAMTDLFGDSGGDDDDEALDLLENELPIPLSRFNYREDWLPENSFGELSEGMSPSRQPSYELAAQKRPLMFYLEPIPLRERVRSYQFLESSMAKWWTKQSGEGFERQYFKILNERGQILWAFRDHLGQWWVHGVFG